MKIKNAGGLIMTVKEFDLYLLNLAKNPPVLDICSDHERFFLAGFRFAIWLIRCFVRENIHVKKAS